MVIQALLYPALILVLAIFILITVPRDALRILLPLSIILGGLVDFLWELVFGHFLKLCRFVNLGIFDMGGMSILAPLAWSLVIIFYLYFWPTNHRYLAYFYILAWAALATGFSQVVSLAGLYEYNSWLYPLPMLIMFGVRFSFAAWVAKPWTIS